MTKGKLTGDLLGKANAPRAVNAASHGCLDEGTDVLVLDSTLVLVHSTLLIAVDDGNVLKIALATLIANWAIKWVICQQELHNTTVYIERRMFRFDS